MKKGIKRIGTLLLAAVMAVSAWGLPRDYGASEVDVDAACSLVIDADDSAVELATTEVTVNLYKVANISTLGDISAVEGLELDFVRLNYVDDTAAEWKALAAEAKALVEAGKVTLAANGKTENGQLTFANLDTGLYLVDAQPTDSDYNHYEFTPYLVSLPNNYSYDGSGGADAWVYDVTVGLKSEKSDLYGDLVITKTLDVYNTSLDGAYFVFQVEGTKTDVDTQQSKVVYIDVVAVNFAAPGTKNIVLEDIPAGSVITVTEVYSGASYELVADGSKAVTIEAVKAEADGFANIAAFANTYSGGLNGGTGLVNTFTYEGGAWTYQATEDSVTRQ